MQKLEIIILKAMENEVVSVFWQGNNRQVPGFVIHLVKKICAIACTVINLLND